jgi:ribulose-5-phosphate 4-epimerase/fuculose-1-phosphate aldolase
MLMKRHGVTVAGSSVRDCVFRSVYSARNADYQVRGMMIGSVASLSPGETQQSAVISAKTTGLTRAWEYWSMRVAKSGGMPAATRKAAAKSRPAKRKKKR